jgi:hypothetical protein
MFMIVSSLSTGFTSSFVGHGTLVELLTRRDEESLVSMPQPDDEHAAVATSPTVLEG